MPNINLNGLLFSAYPSFTCGPQGIKHSINDSETLGKSRFHDNMRTHIEPYHKILIKPSRVVGTEPFPFPYEPNSASELEVRFRFVNNYCNTFTQRTIACSRLSVRGVDRKK